MKTTQVRPYQQRIIAKTVKALSEENARAVLIESATGSGKTFMGHTIGLQLQLMLAAEEGLEIGWIAMRHNLLEQAERENAAFGINAKIHYISMFQKELPQELLNAKKRLIIIDEAQHEAANSMVAIIEAVKPQWMVGLSATPYRSDSLRLCFDKVIKDSSIGQLIREGWLSQFDYYTMDSWSPEAVVETYVGDKKRWGKSIFFFHTQDQCQIASRMLWERGVSNDVVTADSDREQQIADFQAGKLEVLINCMILTEGFDCPDLKTVFCRPSCKGVTIQMAGRAFRLHAGTPIKNVVQCKQTKWVFTRHATPNQSWVRKDNKWVALSPPKELDAMSHAVLKATALIQCTMPAFILNREKKKKNRFQRTENGAIVGSQTSGNY